MAIGLSSLAPAPDYSDLNRKRDFPVHESSGQTLTLHYFRLAFIWTGLLFLVGCLLFVAEWLVGIVYTPVGMARDPLHLVGRIGGLGHYTVATYFLMTSKKIRGLRGMLMLLLFSAIALAACYLAYLGGGYANRVVLLSVGILFLIHGLRDETMFYRLRSGKAISDEEYPYVYRMLIWIQTMVLALAAALLYPVYIYGFFHVAGHVQIAEAIDPLFPAGFPFLAKWFAVGIPFGLFGLTIGAALNYRHPGGIFRFLRSHRPFAIILATYIGITMLTLVFGPGALFLAFFVHFVGWFIFAVANIAKQPKSAQKAITWRTPDKWIRQNMTGFLAFHGGICAIFLVLIAINHYVFADGPVHAFGRTMNNPLSMMLSLQGFVYFTIFHIVLSFMPRPSPSHK